MSDCINSEKPTSAAAKNFPKERKKPSPGIRGRLGSDLIRPFGPPSPLRGRLCMVPCNHARQKESMSLRGGPSGRRGSLRSLPGHFSHRERQGPHRYLPFCVCFGAVHSISWEMSSAYLRKKSGPLSRNSSTDTPSSSSAWQAGSSRGRPKSPCIRRIR